ncbi:OadG family protein [Pelagicoccus sp. NFK12]|uniref:OadG family protein n=1 Tax=Pelagicoccus enzymogenes TaxID=2773457 RepID=A0A927F8K3_9BACT|nr:OadG family transporter subunit [Pelagicoccus enzymogenes]MBD5780292.1 OadG family protein [Pelagicoccus enzymogenes]
MMIPTIAAFGAKPTVMENVSFIVIGFLFVLVVLATLSIVTSLIGVLCTRLIKEPETKKSPPPAPAAPVAPKAQSEGIETEGDIPEHIIALIATATHVILKGRPQRIVSIKGSGQGWAQEGRREIFSSHRVR